MTPGIPIAHEALRRAIAATSPHDELSAIIHTSEALFWLTILDQQHDRARRHPLAPALTMARNAVAHGASICVIKTNGVMSPVISAMRDIDLVWASTETVLAALDRPVASETVAKYEQHLAAKPVDLTLTPLLRWYNPDSLHTDS